MLGYFRNSFLEKIVKSNTFLLLLSDRIVEKFNFLLPYESDWFFFKKFKIKKNSSILDIGAHWGESALTFKKIYPENKIYSFEPHVDSFRKLRINCKNFNIFPFNYGISKKREEKKIFYPTYKNQSLSLWSSDNLLNLKKRIEQYTYLKHKNIIFKSQLCLFKKLPKIKEKISIIKIDVEGAEHKVIESIFGLIKRDEPLLFIDQISNI